MKTNTHFSSHLVQFYTEWEMFQTKAVDKIKTHILCSVILRIRSSRLWDNVENILESDRPQMTIWRMRTAWWITNATDTHSEHVMFIALPWQEGLRERVSVLVIYVDTVTKPCRLLGSVFCIFFSCLNAIGQGADGECDMCNSLWISSMSVNDSFVVHSTILLCYTNKHKLY